MVQDDHPSGCMSTKAERPPRGFIEEHAPRDLQGHCFVLFGALAGPDRPPHRPKPPTSETFSSGKSEGHQRGRKFEADFRYKNLFGASDPPPPTHPWGWGVLPTEVKREDTRQTFDECLDMSRPYAPEVLRLPRGGRCHRSEKAVPEDGAVGAGA